MNTKAKSVQVFEVRLWSKKHFIDQGKIKKPKAYENMIFDGFVVDSKTKKKKFFKSTGQFITAFEKMFKDDEKRGI